MDQIEICNWSILVLLVLVLLVLLLMYLHHSVHLLHKHHQLYIDVHKHVDHQPVAPEPIRKLLVNHHELLKREFGSDHHLTVRNARHLKNFANP